MQPWARDVLLRVLGGLLVLQVPRQLQDPCLHNRRHPSVQILQIWTRCLTRVQYHALRLQRWLLAIERWSRKLVARACQADERSKSVKCPTARAKFRQRSQFILNYSRFVQLQLDQIRNISNNAKWSLLCRTKAAKAHKCCHLIYSLGICDELGPCSILNALFLSFAFVAQ